MSFLVIENSLIKWVSSWNALPSESILWNACKGKRWWFHRDAAISSVFTSLIPGLAVMGLFWHLVLGQGEGDYINNLCGSIAALASLSKSVPLQPCPPCGIIFVWLVFCQLNFLNQLIAGSDKCLDRHIEGRIKLGGLQPHSLDW